MAFRVTIPSQQLEDLARIRDLGPEQLRAVVDRLRAEEKVMLEARQLRAALADILPPEDAESVVRQMLSLYAARRREELEPVQMVEGLTNGLRALRGPNKWKPDEIHEWVKISGELRDLLSLEKVGYVAKAVDLAYAYDPLFQNVRIVTDIRPVFAAELEQEPNILGAVITHTLRVYYDDADGDHTLNIAVDEKDIGDLLSACERALKKGQAAKQFLSKRCGIEVALAGESTE